MKLLSVNLLILALGAASASGLPVAPVEAAEGLRPCEQSSIQKTFGPLIEKISARTPASHEPADGELGILEEITPYIGLSPVEVTQAYQTVGSMECEVLRPTSKVGVEDSTAFLIRPDIVKTVAHEFVAKPLFDPKSNMTMEDPNDLARDLSKCRFQTAKEKSEAISLNLQVGSNLKLGSETPYDSRVPFYRHSDQDYAFVKLPADIPNAVPFQLNHKGPPRKGDRVVMISAMQEGFANPKDRLIGQVCTVIHVERGDDGNATVIQTNCTASRGSSGSMLLGVDPQAKHHHLIIGTSTRGATLAAPATPDHSKTQAKAQAKDDSEEKTDPDKPAVEHEEYAIGVNGFVDAEITTFEKAHPSGAVHTANAE